MKDFTYYNNDKTNLHIDSCDWLEETGLKETLWIIDGQWFFGQNNFQTFKDWIGE